ncbi:hypothetical protein Hanom_Chr12g01104491 [Helianthus anomalus]
MIFFVRVRLCLCLFVNFRYWTKRTQTNVHEHRRTQTKENKHKQAFMNINEHKPPPLSCIEDNEEHIGDWNESGK